MALKRDNLVQLCAVAPLAPTDGELPEPARQATSGKITGFDLDSGCYKVWGRRAPPSRHPPASSHRFEHPPRQAPAPAFAPQVALEPSGEAELPPACVRLADEATGQVCGLQGAPEHNGKEGYILSYDAAADRCARTTVGQHARRAAEVGRRVKLRYDARVGA